VAAVVGAIAPALAAPAAVCLYALAERIHEIDHPRPSDTCAVAGVLIELVEADLLAL
jgi:hypothetical protein